MSAASATVVPSPYRETAVVSGSDVVSSLGLSLLLLALLAGSAVYARRRGWLDRWLPQAPNGERPKRLLSVVESLSISRRTRLIRVRRGDTEWLLAESDTTLLVLRSDDTEQTP